MGDILIQNNTKYVEWSLGIPSACRRVKEPRIGSGQEGLEEAN